jgi:hypothetical protein
MIKVMIKVITLPLKPSGGSMVNLQSGFDSREPEYNKQAQHVNQSKKKLKSA